MQKRAHARVHTAGNGQAPHKLCTGQGGHLDRALRRVLGIEHHDAIALGPALRVPVPGRQLREWRAHRRTGRTPPWATHAPARNAGPRAGAVASNGGVAAWATRGGAAPAPAEQVGTARPGEGKRHVVQRTGPCRGRCGCRRGALRRPCGTGPSGPATPWSRAGRARPPAPPPPRARACARVCARACVCGGACVACAARKGQAAPERGINAKHTKQDM